MQILDFKNQKVCFNTMIMMKEVYGVSSRCYHAALIDDTNYKS